MAMAMALAVALAVAMAVVMAMALAMAVAVAMAMAMALAVAVAMAVAVAVARAMALAMAMAMDKLLCKNNEIKIMKKILLINLLSFLSINSYAAETNIMALLGAPHGKAGHHFDSVSTHSFYIYNDDSVPHVYNWEMKQCYEYEGKYEKCPAYDSGKLTLVPGQVFQFGHYLTLDLFCTDKYFKVNVHANSYLKRDDGKSWIKDIRTIATCE